MTASLPCNVRVTSHALQFAVKHWRMDVGDGPGAELHADIEHLTQSGLAVTKHGEGLATSHTAADALVESAAGGWQGLSSAAMATRSEA